MIKCRQCKQMISRSTLVCPHCGTWDTGPAWRLTLIIGLCFIVPMVVPPLFTLPYLPLPAAIFGGAICITILTLFVGFCVRRISGR